MRPSIITFESYKHTWEGLSDFQKYYQPTFELLCKKLYFSLTNKESRILDSKMKNLFEREFEKISFELLSQDIDICGYKVDLTKPIKAECKLSALDKKIDLKINLVSIEYTVIDTVLDWGSNYNIQRLLLVEGDQSENLKTGNIFSGEIIKLNIPEKFVTYKPII